MIISSSDPLNDKGCLSNIMLNGYNYLFYPFTESRGDPAHWPTSGDLYSEKGLTTWNTKKPHNVHNLSETLNPSGSPSPSTASMSTRAKASSAPRESFLYWTPGLQLQQRVQLVKLLPLLYICTHSHCVWFMSSVSLWPILCVKS